jgi:hypothetical protein
MFILKERESFDDQVGIFPFAFSSTTTSKVLLISRIQADEGMTSQSQIVTSDGCWVL